MSYSRYKSFVGGDGTIKTVPFITIPNHQSDKFIYWNNGISRLDLLSYRYYNSPDYAWLILQANPTLPSMEFLIPTGSKVRIPLPLESVLVEYENNIKIYNQVEGIE